MNNEVRGVGGDRRQAGRTCWRGAAAAAAVTAAVATAGLGSPPAAGDYAPYIVFDDSNSAAEPLAVVAGQQVTFGNDFSGQCPSDDPLPWTFGVLTEMPQIAGPVSFAEVIQAGDVLPDAEGNWSVTLTLPADLAPGSYAVGTSCLGYPQGQQPGPGPAPVLYDYFPGLLEVGGGTTTTSTATTEPPPVSMPTATPTPEPTPPPAQPRPGNANYTG